MSKGWTRRPTSVERSEYDAAWERTFADEKRPKSLSTGEVLIGYQVLMIDGFTRTVPIYADPSGGIASVPDFEPLPRKRPVLDGCEIADVLTPHFNDGWTRA